MADIQGSKIIVRSVAVGAIMTNCYCIRREDSRDSVIVDPGAAGKELYGLLSEKGLSCKAILVTHAHFDHIGGLDALKELSGAEVMACEKEKRLFGDPELSMLSDVGMKCEAGVDRWLKDGEVIDAAGISFTVMETPGHTEGSCCFYCPEGSFLISGDTMFCGSCGRTDFPTGNDRDMHRSLMKLLELPEETAVYPGHDSPTTIGRERKTWS